MPGGVGGGSRKASPYPDPQGAARSKRAAGEQVFAKLKTLLRRAGARRVDDLWRAIGRCLDAFTPTECANYLASSGYVPR